MSSYYLYKLIPDMPKNWTLAVYAVDRQDADQYMTAYHRGGMLQSTIKDEIVKTDYFAGSNKVQADCFAITKNARKAGNP